MITVRRTKERHSEPGSEGKLWLSFDPQDPGDPLANGFGNLEFLVEGRLAPGAHISFHPPSDSQTLTYVHEGTLAYANLLDGPCLIQAGEFQSMYLAGETSQRIGNASKTETAHFFHIRLRAAKHEGKGSVEQKRFTVAERKGRLSVIASPDARSGSLRIETDVLMYSAELDPGQHVVHALLPGRSAWLQVVDGEIRLNDTVLNSGDGAGFLEERAASITALTSASILLFSLSETQPKPAVLEAALAALPMAAPSRRNSAHNPGMQASVSPALAAVSGPALFNILKDALSGILGPSSTATLFRRAALRAQLFSPGLAEFAITRVGPDYAYSLPTCFSLDAGSPGCLGHLMDEVRTLLVEQTGRVVLRSFAGVPELQRWAA